MKRPIAGMKKPAEAMNSRSWPRDSGSDWPVGVGDGEGWN